MDDSIEGVFEDLYDILFKTPVSNLNHKIYDYIIDDNLVLLKKYCARWREESVPIELESYKECFHDLCLITPITKFRDFEYRLLLSKLVFNEELYVWGMVQDDKCSFCEKETENASHLLFNCEFIQPLITWYYKLCKLCNITPQGGSTNFIFNNVIVRPRQHILHFVNIVLKQYVYRTRCQGKKPSLTEFKHDVDSIEKLLFTIAKSKNRLT